MPAGAMSRAEPARDLPAVSPAPRRPTPALTETPFLEIDLDIVSGRLAELRRALPEVQILYAVKANPAPEIISLLMDCGVEFDVASPAEIGLCLRLGAAPGTLSYGNTIKKERDIADAVSRGVRRFTVDSPAELEKVVRWLGSGSVFIRVATTGEGA